VDHQRVDDWALRCPKTALLARAALYRRIRVFFEMRGVSEVETPILGPTTVTDPYIESLRVSVGNGQQLGFLQTSPEYAMKRLLASGVGSIFQICKAFRAEERGRYHRQEFSMLEWYRIDFGLFQLMAEMRDLLVTVAGCPQVDQVTYQALFLQYLQIDPLDLHAFGSGVLAQIIEKNMPRQFNRQDLMAFDRDDLLMILMSSCIEPHVGRAHPVMVYHYPVTQAALSRIDDDCSPPVAGRFEVYWRGVELANGFHELQDSLEQRRRFEANGARRSALGLPQIAMDERLLNALSAGLPDCAGVALGLDRLLMLMVEKDTLEAVLAIDDLYSA
jgi:lysyl-tRNA synthetase class 2